MSTAEQTPVEIIPLDNGLELQLYDASRNLVGDRWNVVLLAQIVVDVVDPEAAERLGKRVTYEQKRERVFVDNREKGDAFGELRASFLRNQLQYLSRPDFAQRFVERQLALLNVRPTL